jgi:hypothetical protein
LAKILAADGQIGPENACSLEASVFSGGNVGFTPHTNR